MLAIGDVNFNLDRDFVKFGFYSREGVLQSPWLSCALCKALELSWLPWLLGLSEISRARRDLAATWPRLGQTVATTSSRTRLASQIQPRSWAKNRKNLSQMAGNTCLLTAMTVFSDSVKAETLR